MYMSCSRSCAPIKRILYSQTVSKDTPQKMTRRAPPWGRCDFIAVTTTKVTVALACIVQPVADLNHSLGRATSTPQASSLKIIVKNGTSVDPRRPIATSRCKLKPNQPRLMLRCHSSAQWAWLFDSSLLRLLQSHSASARKQA